MPKGTKKKREPFRFKPGFSIGGVAAETDPLLETCFIATDCYNAISKMEDPRCAIVGRSGTGKTAILEALKKEHEGNVVVINPEALAFDFLGKSEMIRALRSSGVNLDYFYKLVWRHVLVVEVLKHYFPEESKRYSLLSHVIEHIKKTIKPQPVRERAIKYLDEWDASILQSPQERIQEIHNNFGKRLRAKLGFGGWADILGLGTGVEGEVISTTERTERIRIANEVVSQIQVHSLNAARDYIGSAILDDPQKPCYVLIDDLDRFWVEDPLVYELIRGLILEIYEWRKVRRLKVIYALRNNIVNRIETEFRTRSYQKEKLEDQRYYMHWTRQELTEVVNKRLERTSEGMQFVNTPTLNDILPKRSSRHPSGTEYIFDRTLDRPRDIIDFLNKAGALCITNERISMVALRNAEDSYSNGRLGALFDEWRENYPGLEILMKLLRGYPPRFPLSYWSESDITEVLTDKRIPQSGWALDMWQEFAKHHSENPSYAVSQCRKRLLQLLFEVGIVGAKVTEGGTLRYCYAGSPMLSDVEIEEDPQVAVHPAFHRALGIEPWKQ